MRGIVTRLEEVGRTAFVLQRQVIGKTTTDVGIMNTSDRRTGFNPLDGHTVSLRRRRVNKHRGDDGVCGG
jgi:hypothetical protein